MGNFVSIQCGAWMKRDGNSQEGNSMEPKMSAPHNPSPDICVPHIPHCTPTCHDVSIPLCGLLILFVACGHGEAPWSSGIWARATARGSYRQLLQNWGCARFGGRPNNTCQAATGRKRTAWGAQRHDVNPLCMSPSFWPLRQHEAGDGAIRMRQRDHCHPKAPSSSPVWVRPLLQRLAPSLGL